MATKRKDDNQYYLILRTYKGQMLRDTVYIPLTRPLTPLEADVAHKIDNALNGLPLTLGDSVVIDTHLAFPVGKGSRKSLTHRGGKC